MLEETYSTAFGGADKQNLRSTRSGTLLFLEFFPLAVCVVSKQDL